MQVSGQTEDQMNQILSLFDTETKKEVQNFLDSFVHSKSWKLWYIRWLFLSYVYFYGESKVDKKDKNIKLILKHMSMKKKEMLDLANRLKNRIISFNTNKGAFKDFKDSDEAFEVDLKLLIPFYYNKDSETRKEFIDKAADYDTNAFVHNISAVVKEGRFWDQTIFAEKLQNMPLTFESYSYVINIFNRANKERERSYAEENSKGHKTSGLREVTTQEDIDKKYKITRIYEVSGGRQFFWSDLQTNYSKEMVFKLGNCGRASDDSSNLHVLQSTFYKEGLLILEAHLLLEVSNNFYITQAKGAGNQPQPKYKQYIQDFLINNTLMKGTQDLSDEESLSIVSTREDLDFMLNNVNRKFDFMDLFIKLIKNKCPELLKNYDAE